MTKLRQRMIEDLRIRNYAAKTIEAYIRCTAEFARHFDKSPDQLGVEHIRDYQVFLVETKKASWAVFNQTVCALRFLYRVTLRRSEIIEHIPFPKQEKILPVILSTEELTRFFGAVTNLKHRTVLMTMYAAGFRLSEALGLWLSDIDSSRMVVRVRHGLEGQLARLADRHQGRVQLQRQRGGEEKPPRLGRGNHVDPLIAEPLGHLADRLAERLWRRQERRDVAKQDPRLGEVGDRSDVVGQLQVG